MLNGTTNEQKIWNYLKAAGLNDFGTAGLMGNLYKESGLKPNNLQNSYEQKLGYTDESYTAAVDNSSYTNFASDAAGYGLAQWTFHTRKAGLLSYAKSKGKSIGDLEMQLEYLMKELKESYAGVLSVLKTATSVQEASDAVLMQFERPANAAAKKSERADCGQAYLNKFAEMEERKMSFTNSPLVSYTKISPNRTKNRNHAIDTITIHCVVGQCSVQTLGEVFAPTTREASSNYGVGYDGKIGMYCEEKDRSWCSSNAANDHRAVTIEVASDTTEPYAVNDKAYAAMLDLVTDICKRNGIKKLVWSNNKDDRVNHRNGCNMTVHRDYANKSCPGTYLYERHGAIAAEVNRRLGASGDAPAEPKPTQPATELKFGAGDIVAFAGGTHYTSADAATGSTAKAGTAKITAVKVGGKHPYHCRAVNDAGAFVSGVYGWVDAATVSAVKAEASGDTVYVVKKGDTLSGIAAKYGTTYQALAEYNGITNPNIISVGQKIKIPKKGATAAPTVRKHTVVRGDTLWALAVKYLGNGSRYPEIMKASGITSTTLTAGQVLTIPEK